MRAKLKKKIGGRSALAIDPKKKDIERPGAVSHATEIHQNYINVINEGKNSKNKNGGSSVLAVDTRPAADLRRKFKQNERHRSGLHTALLDFCNCL